AQATTTAATTTTTTTPPEAAPSSSALELSPQPIYQEQIRDIGVIPINQTHLQITYSGNGTLNLPNGTEPIITTSSTSGIGALVDSDFAGKEVLTTEDGSESATARVYELVRFSMQEGTGRGIVMAVFHTNSTGMIAPLEGMILAGIIELSPDGTGSVTLWEWQSGIPLPTATTTTPPLEELPPLMDDTSTTTTNATTADTDATAGPPEEEGGVVEEQQPQQQTTPTIPAPNPLFE
ncbi:MAG: hypothetical protein M3146_07770, partial [Thermoproteota archaeon]|nr:hypothetical protein [Thermoproteota archaeon]